MTRHSFPILAIALAMVACKQKTSDSPVILRPGMAARGAPAPNQMKPGASPQAQNGKTQTAGANEKGPRPGIGPSLHWTAPAEWPALSPQSGMRDAQYKVPAFGTDKDDAQLAVFYFGPTQGGSVDSNVARWEGQFTEPDGKPSTSLAKVEKRTVNKITVTTLYVKGSYASDQPRSGEGPHQGWAMLGAIAETPVGPWFFKMVGPEKTVNHAEGAFDTMVSTFVMK